MYVVQHVLVNVMQVCNKTVLCTLCNLVYGYD